MEVLENKRTDIPGWGIDANRENDPTYPMKNRNDSEQAGYTWERPTQQHTDVEVLHSNERPNLTAVFGESTPPSGLSGMIRRQAFKHSESSYAHWLPLMLADRINVVEGLVADISGGKIPNIFAELGWRAEWKHNRKNLLLRLGIRALVIGAIVVAAKRRRSRQRVVLELS